MQAEMIMVSAWFLLLVWQLLAALPDQDHHQDREVPAAVHSISIHVPLPGRYYRSQSRLHKSAALIQCYIFSLQVLSYKPLLPLQTKDLPAGFFFDLIYFVLSTASKQY